MKYKSCEYEKFYISPPLFYSVVAQNICVHALRHACCVLHAPYTEQSVNFYFFMALYVLRTWTRCSRESARRTALRRSTKRKKE